MSQEKAPLQGVLKRTLHVWMTVFLVMFGILALVASIYQIFIVKPPDLSPLYVLFAGSGLVALIAGIGLYLRGRRRNAIRRQADYTARSKLMQGNLHIQVKLPENRRVKEVILDTEPVRRVEDSYLPVRIRKR